MVKAAFAVAILWALAVVVRAVATWPSIPLDMSRNDPATEAAFRAAQIVHIGGHVIIGLTPLLIVALITLLIVRPKSRD